MSLFSNPRGFFMQVGGQLCINEKWPVNQENMNSQSPCIRKSCSRFDEWDHSRYTDNDINIWKLLKIKLHSAWQKLTSGLQIHLPNPTHSQTAPLRRNFGQPGISGVNIWNSEKWQASLLSYVVQHQTFIMSDVQILSSWTNKMDQVCKEK